MRIAIFNVKYSANLGDGLLAECLEVSLRRAGFDLEVLTLDLAGRESYGQGGLSNRKLALATLELMPPFIRRWAVGQVLTRLISKRLRPQWGRALANVDAAVVGGGNLLADADLNFPLKIAGAMAECAERGIPVAVHGVGVSDNWSKRGVRLFRAAFGGVKLIHAAVRDERSRAVWEKNLASAGLRSATVCHDPAILTSRVFPVVRTAARSARRVAIGLTSPLALRYHVKGRSFTAQQLTDWFDALIRLMIQAGWQVSLFTNGSGEDLDYLRSFQAKFGGGPGVTMVPPFCSPGELAAFIAQQDLIMAHRMHACIAAYSYAVPHIGFRWDPKLDSFFEAVGRGEYVITAGEAAPAAVAALATQAVEVGVDSPRYRNHLDRTAREIGELAARLTSLAG